MRGRFYNSRGVRGVGRGLGGLGATADELRRQANARGLQRLTDNMRGTASSQLEKYGGTLDALANLGAAIQSGGDFTRQLNAVYDAASSVAALFPVYGQVVGVLLEIMQALTKWIASAVPALPTSCQTYPKQAAQHYARVKWGLSLSPDDAEARVYRDEKMFFIGTVLYRRLATQPFQPAPGCFWMWHDYPMAAPSGAVLEPAIIGSNQRMVRWTDAFLSNTDYTLRLDASGSLSDKERFLSVATRPWRKFPSPISPASGYRDWYEYLEAHPDNEGSAAAIEKGDQLVRKLLSDGHGEYMGWGYDSSTLGYRSWLSGYFVTVEGLDDETIFALLRWFSTLPTEDLREGTVLPIDMMVIPPEADPSAGSGWGWHPGLDYFLRDFILNNGPYMAYHYSVLLQEYRRRKAAGTWTISARPIDVVGGASRLPGILYIDPAMIVEGKEEKKDDTKWSTGTKVVVGAGVVGAIAGITKLLRLW